MVRLSEKILNAPDYPFARLAKRKKELQARGVDLLDFGVGECGIPTPRPVVNALRDSIENPETHRYSSYNGTPEFRKAVAAWLEKTYGFSLDPEREITALIGSKEAIFRFPQTVIDPGDVALVPDPAYPVYRSGALHAGAEVYTLPLKEENGFVPDLESVPGEILFRSKLIYLNYPNNPTGAEMTRPAAEKILDYAEKYDLAVLSDMAYGEVFDRERPISLLELDRGRRVIEFFSFSKGYSMTGWRIGFAAGSGELIKALLKVKSEQGSSPFGAVQDAAIAALDMDPSETNTIRHFYARNRERIEKIFERSGFKFFKNQAGFYIYASVPEGYTSESWTVHLMENHGIVTVPGSALGQFGEGYFRLSVTRSPGEIDQLEERLKGVKI